MGKMYVPVMVQITEDGEVTPMKVKIRPESESIGEWVEIIEASKDGRRASYRGGGVGIRYRCTVHCEEQKITLYLYNEGEKWFVETDGVVKYAKSGEYRNMPNILLTKELSAEEKLELMREDAEYDVCDNEPGAYGIAAAKEVKSGRQPPKVPKIYMANKCIFDCKYCCHRCANEKKRGMCMSRRNWRGSRSSRQNGARRVYSSVRRYTNRRTIRAS